MTPALARLHLVLCLTRGGSIRQWQESGLLAREMALYQTMRPHLAGITLVSYGQDRFNPPLQELAGITLVGNSWGMNAARYQRLRTWLPKSWCWQPTVFKSNQMLGAELAVALARRWRKAGLVRCGYPLARFREYRFGADSPQVREARALESHCFHRADRIVVTSQAMASEVMEGHGIAATKVRVIANYVDDRLFFPAPRPAPAPYPTLLTIGRLEEQKNLATLLSAMAGLPARLVVVGDGTLRPALEAQARHLALDATFLPRRSHEALPELLRQADIFVLPSLYEGHPKALIEAMACGLPVVGCPVPGVGDLLQHERTGLLAPATPQGLGEALQRLLQQPDLRRDLGEQAARFAKKHFALSSVAQQELALLEEMVTMPKEGL